MSFKPYKPDPRTPQLQWQFFVHDAAFVRRVSLLHATARQIQTGKGVVLRLRR